MGSVTIIAVGVVVYKMNVALALFCQLDILNIWYGLLLMDMEE